MTAQTNQKWKPTTDYFGLRVEYSNDLPDNVSGFLNLETAPAQIVLNARKPACDHALTVGHELGHYIMHQNRARKFPLPWFLNHPWKWKSVRRGTRIVRMMVSKHFGAEWEADFWAFIFLLSIGAIDELFAVVELYPAKKYLLWLSALALVLGASRRIEAGLASLPFVAGDLLKSSLSRNRSLDDQPHR